VTVVSGLYSVKYVSIPLFLTFRRCGILSTIIINFLITGKYPNTTLAGCAFFIVLGALLAGYESFDDNAFGYLLIWGNNFSQSIYHVVASIFNEGGKINSFEINFYFALITLPLMSFLTVSNGDFEHLWAALCGQDTTQTLLIILSGISGIAYTMSSILNVTLCGPIAQNIACTIKDIGLTYVGFIFFKSSNLTVASAVGISKSFMAASYLTYTNFKNAKT
jgi:solute carrier family 35 protein